MRRWGVIGLVLVAAAADALHHPGDRLPVVELAGVDGRLARVPERGIGALVTYESRSSENQNTALKQRLAAIVRRPGNAARLRYLAVGDVEAYSWWPVREIATLRARGKQVDAWAPIYCDWDGDLRRGWSLARDASAVILLGPDGEVRFASEGPVTAPQVSELLRRLAELAVDVRQ